MLSPVSLISIVLLRRTFLGFDDKIWLMSKSCSTCMHQPVSCPSPVCYRVRRLAIRSWWGLRCQQREAFCVSVKLCIQWREQSLQLPISSPGGATSISWPVLAPPHTPYTQTQGAYRCSPSMLHCSKDTGRLTAARQRWQITPALPETLRQ